MNIKHLFLTFSTFLISSLSSDIIAQDFAELHKKATAGEVWAMNNLANCYANGQEVGKDLDKAVYWYNEGVKNGCEVAMYNLSFYYKDGTVVEKSNEKALELLRRSAKKNYSYASAKLGIAYFEGDFGLKINYGIAHDYLKNACFTGDVTAMCYYGWIYAMSLGVEQDKYKAKYWFEKSIENGYEYAYIPLYILSLDDSEAYGSSEYYKSQALKSIDYSKFSRIIDEYYYRAFVQETRDWVKNKYAQTAFEISYDNYQKTNDLYACATVGFYYERGVGVEKNLETALTYYIKSYELGRGDAIYDIRRVCEQLDRFEVLFEILSRDPETNNTDILNMLAYCYAEGKGTSVNFNMAHKTIDKAIQIDSQDANLYDSKGEFYMLNNDIKNAKKMYKQVKKIDPTFYINNTSSNLHNYINSKK